MSELSSRPVFELRRLPEKTNEALLAELCRVAALIPGQPLTVSALEKYGKVSRNVYTRRFGGWTEALEAAGLSAQSSNNIVTRGAHPSTHMLDGDILTALRELAARLNVSELTVELIGKHLPISAGVLRKRWGTAQAAFEAAGLNTSSLGRRYNDEECYQNMLAVWTHYGRPPKHLEMGLSPSKVGGKAYIKRFGTWNKALAAFVDRVNAEPGPDVPPIDSNELMAPGPSLEERPVRNGEDARDIALGLRFRVLHRDRFKCVLCGDHPARNADCRLHVDHILPWSKGGRTREDNLRALCAKCNVGRGNHFLD